MKGYQFMGGESNSPINNAPTTPNNKKPAISKKELEVRRQKDDDKAAAQAFEEYMAVFQETGGHKAPNKVWIKAGTYEAGKKQDEQEKGKLYKPTSRFEKDEPKPETYMPEELRPERLGKKKEKEKKKSNLEIFKEELKIIQEEREERYRLKSMLGLQEVIKLPPKPGDDLRASLSLELDDVKMGSIDDGDPNTTNIYLGNLPTKISEQQLMDVFGKFGPLASVKVMWPRTDEEKSRNRLSGFVAFMSRRDGERALKHLAGREILGAEIKLGWGKAVPIPAYPVYVPPAMMEMTMPPPLSGLPFNAQPDKRDRHKIPPPGTPYPTDPRGIEEFEKVLKNSSIKVVMPTDRTILALIHRMVEFVTREGPMFEAMIMNREISNPQYRFLFENQSPAHVYYRWKLYSILQGDSTQRWRTDDFKMFRDGSQWKPPTLNPFTQGMPDELIPEDERDIRKGTLSNAQRERLERMLRAITPERHRVAEVMIFSIEHSESAEEICQCIKESLLNPKTTRPKKVARLYIISDILHNCSAKGMNAFGYRKWFKGHLPSIFQEMHFGYQTACAESVGSTSTTAESFKQRVMACFKAWEDWTIYPNEFLIRLQNIFLGLLTVNSREEEAKIFEGLEDEEDEEMLQKKRRKSPPRAHMPPKSALNLIRSLQSIDPSESSGGGGGGGGDEDIDGVPMDEDIDGEPIEPESIESTTTSSSTKIILNIDNPEGAGGIIIVDNKPKGGFIPSKWETVDPEDVKAQAVTTTSKWDLFEDNSNNSSSNSKNEKEGIVGGGGEGGGRGKSGSSSVGGGGGGGGGLVDYDEDLDGVPMDEDEDDEDDDENIERSQQQQHSYKKQPYMGKVGVEIYEDESTEERRLKLREVENKVLTFQDELESGRKKIKHGETIQYLIQEYREKLLRKAEKERLEMKKEVVEMEEDDENYGEEYYSSSSRSHRKHSERESRNLRERDTSSRSERDTRDSRRHRSPSFNDGRDRDSGRTPPSSRSSEKSRRHYSPTDEMEIQTPKHSSNSSRRRSRSRTPRRSSHSHSHRRSSRSKSPSTRRHRHKNKH